MTDEFIDDPTLQDPDGENEVKYAWDEEFQRYIIALLLSDRSFLLQSLDLIKANYFTNRAHQKACSVVFKYFRQHRTLPPKAFIVQEIKTDLKDNKSLPAYLAEVNVVYDYFQPGLDTRDYLTQKIQYFAKMQAFRRAFHDGLKLLDENPESEENWQQIYTKIESVITTSANFEHGTDYFKSTRDRYLRMLEDEETRERFVLGLPHIDNEIKGGGYSRGEIFSVVAGSGVGKSVLLACIAATNLLRGKKGVYITLELAESKVAERMDAILTGFPIQNLYSHKDEIFERLEALEQVDQDNMPLVIKQFPAGTATINTVRAYLAQLKIRNYNPDFLILDYIGEMADIPGMKTYESREKTVRDLRGMAMEENIFVATAMQPNRDSKKEASGEQSRIDDQHLADAFGQIRPLDGCLSLNQNDNEKELGIGRGYVIKQRDGKSRYQIYLRFDKESLRITEMTQEAYRSLMSSRKDRVSEDVKFDMVDRIIAPFDEGHDPCPPIDDDKPPKDEEKK